MQNTQAIDVAENLIFVVALQKVQGYLHHSKTGQQVQTSKSGSEVPNKSFWLDICYDIHIFKCCSDEYLVFVKENPKAKVAMYRLQELWVMGLGIEELPTTNEK